MNQLVCPNGCGALSVFIAVRGVWNHVYVGCRGCGYAEWPHGNTSLDECGADGFEGVDPPVEYDVIDRVTESDPYSP